MTIHCNVIEFGTPAFDEAVALRYLVLRKPLDMEYDTKDIEKEYDQIHIGCYGSGKLIGCLSLQHTGKEEVKMRQVAIHPDYQRLGIGRKLVIYSEDLAIKLNKNVVYCHARLNAVPFYVKLEYKKVGEQFEEVGIPHFLMVKKFH
jgi:predicted GNAT family N-acyltransferase